MMWIGGVILALVLGFAIRGIFKQLSPEDEFKRGMRERYYRPYDDEDETKP